MKKADTVLIPKNMISVEISHLDYQIYKFLF